MDAERFRVGRLADFAENATHFLIVRRGEDV
jgi:hypothetical protein